MKKHLIVFWGSLIGVVALTPSFAQAAIQCTGGRIKDIKTFLCAFADLTQLATGILGALALLVFFWGLVKYIVKADDEKAKESGRNIMVWGVIALFVMFSIFGLVRFLQGSFGINDSNNTAPDIPTLIY